LADKPADKRADLRGPLIVTQVKMGDDRKYFFGYAKNISRGGIFVHTLTPKGVGEVFSLELCVPNSDIIIKCRCRVAWSRRFSEAGGKDPGMGIQFLDLDPDMADRIEGWVMSQHKSQEEEV
jgi:uncharacterized protein (TIGR02266 family)